MQTDQIQKNVFKIMNKTPRGHRFKIWNADVTLTYFVNSFSKELLVEWFI